MIIVDIFINKKQTAIESYLIYIENKEYLGKLEYKSNENFIHLKNHKIKCNIFEIDSILNGFAIYIMDQMSTCPSTQIMENNISIERVFIKTLLESEIQKHFEQLETSLLFK